MSLEGSDDAADPAAIEVPNGSDLTDAGIYNDVRGNCNTAAQEMAVLRNKLSEMQAKEANLRETHRTEMLELQQRLQAEMDSERERLLNQIRELAKLRKESPASQLEVCLSLRYWNVYYNNKQGKAHVTYA